MHEFDEVDGGSVAAEAVMLRNDDLKSILVVEGVADHKFFAKFRDESSCEIVIAHGRENALDAAKILNENKFPGFVVVVDSDYDQILGINTDVQNLIKTDERDIEIMMIRSSALDCVLREIGSENKLQRFCAGGGDVRKVIQDAAFSLGVVRVCSLREGLNLDFKSLDYSFVSRDGSVNLTEMQRAIANKNRVHALPDIVAEYLGSWGDGLADRWQVCCGHDCSRILGRLLRWLLGNLNAKDAAGEEIESRLRLAYDSAEFRKTGLSAALRAWEATNTPFRLFAADR